MLHMPDACLEDLLDIIGEVENGAPWPSQVVTGIVAALAKTPEAKTTNQYRPICIFTFTYRVWASIRAKQCLRFLEGLVPHTLLGNIPGKSPKQLWFHIQQAIEYSYAQGAEIAGCVVDIVKCFNVLPREPLLSLAKLLGFPTEVLVPWESALTQMTRRFQVRGSTGRAINSSCGFPEGCPLSVVGMVLCNIIGEVYMICKNPKIQTWSFVDNLETVAKCAAEALQSMEDLAEFCSLLGLQLDANKSYVWCNTPDGRKLIRDHNQIGKLFARDLGGHLNYSKLRTNCTLQDKIAQFVPFWNRLCRSFAAASQKERALVVSAWPNLFYGICTVSLGNAHFEKLRTSACRSLNLTQNGVNPMLQLSCVGNPKADPEYYCLFTTVMSFRDCHCENMTEFVMDQLIQGQNMTPGPCSSLLRVLHKIAWTWQGGGVCLDQDGLPCNILGCPKMELSCRLLEAWQTRVFSLTTAMRKTMDGLQNADARLTQQCLRSIPVSGLGLMRCALNGTQFTYDALVHTGAVATAQCQFCQQNDSQRHRHWECSFFSDIRSKYPDLTTLPANAKDCLLNHGWLPKAPGLADLRTQLLQAPDTTMCYVHPPEVAAKPFYKDLFTDGSCTMPTDPLLRLATWGVVEWTGEEFWPVARGRVGGWKQTSLRGEITAVIASLKIAVRSKQPCRIWTDNAEVFKILRRLLAGDDPHVAKKPDADLWNTMVNQFFQCASNIHDVFKVKAHTEMKDQETPLDEWATRGNNMADQTASSARQDIPQDFWRLWNEVYEHQQQYQKLGHQVHAMYVEIAERAKQTHTVSAPLTEPSGFEDSAATVVDPGILHLIQLDEKDIPKHFRNEETSCILRWLKTISSNRSAATWVSFHQLLIDYQKFSQRLGPSSHKGKWMNTPIDQPYSHKQHTLWLSQFLKNISKHAGFSVTIEQRRPPSHVIAFWSGCIRVHMPIQKLQEIDNHLKNYVSVMPVRNITLHMAEVMPG